MMGVVVAHDGCGHSIIGVDTTESCRDKVTMQVVVTTWSCVLLLEKTFSHKITSV